MICDECGHSAAAHSSTHDSLRTCPVPGCTCDLSYIAVLRVRVARLSDLLRAEHTVGRHKCPTCDLIEERP